MVKESSLLESSSIERSELTYPGTIILVEVPLCMHITWSLGLPTQNPILLQSLHSLCIVYVGNLTVADREGKIPITYAVSYIVWGCVYCMHSIRGYLTCACICEYRVKLLFKENLGCGPSHWAKWWRVRTRLHTRIEENGPVDAHSYTSTHKHTGFR